MPVVSTDSLQLAIVEEVTPGETPASPAFLLVRASSESITFSPNTSASTELNGGGGRCQRPSNVTGTTVGGDIGFEAAPAPWFDAAMAGVLGASWGECPLTGAQGGAIDDPGKIAIGDDLKTFTIEKRVPDPDVPGSYFYQRYKGCSFSVLNLNVTPNETVTGTLSIIGGVPELATTAIAGATYASAGNSSVFTAPQVTELSVGSELDVGTNCWTSAVINLDSQNRGIPCIGSTGDREVVLGQLAATLSGEVYFNDQDILIAMLDNQQVGDSSLVLTNADGDVLRFDLFAVKPTAASVVTPGSNQDYTMPLTLEPSGIKICDDGGGNDWSSCVMVSKVDEAPVLPAMVMSDVYMDGALLAPS